MILKAHLDDVFTWEASLSPGIAKSKDRSLSTAEVGYIASDSCCAQFLWMRQMMEDFGVALPIFTTYCDNMINAISISKNLV